MTHPTSRPFPHRESVLPGADFGDCFGLTTTGLDLDAEEGARRAFGRTPGWIRGLMRVRNLMTAPFGLKSGRIGAAPGASRIGMFPVLSRSPERIVMGLDDRHLDFRIVVEVRALDGRRQDLSAATAVRTHNRFGRAYLTIVKPFHRLIVPAMLKQAATGREPSRQG